MGILGILGSNCGDAHDAGAGGLRSLAWTGLTGWG